MKNLLVFTLLIFTLSIFTQKQQVYAVNEINLFEREGNLPSIVLDYDEWVLKVWIETEKDTVDVAINGIDFTVTRTEGYLFQSSTFNIEDLNIILILALNGFELVLDGKKTIIFQEPLSIESSIGLTWPSTNTEAPPPTEPVIEPPPTEPAIEPPPTEPVIEPPPTEPVIEPPPTEPVIEPPPTEPVIEPPPTEPVIEPPPTEPVIEPPPTEPVIEPPPTEPVIEPSPR